MATDISLQSGEVLLSKVPPREYWRWLGAPHSMYSMAVSNQALFIVEKRRGLVLRDPWYMRRIALGDVLRVSTTRVSPSQSYVLGGLLFLGGLTLTLILVSIGGVSVLPGLMIVQGGPAIVAAAFLGAVWGAGLIYSARCRVAIAIECTTERIVARPPDRLGWTSATRVSRLQEDFLDACVKAGVRVEQGPNQPNPPMQPAGSVRG